jgi:hypothetical protein
MALQALKIGVVIRVGMEDRGAAIPVGKDMIEAPREIGSWLAGHCGET